MSSESLFLKVGVGFQSHVIRYRDFAIAQDLVSRCLAERGRVREVNIDRDKTKDGEKQSPGKFLWGKKGKH